MATEATDPEIPLCISCGKRYNTMIQLWHSIWCEACFAARKDRANKSSPQAR